jgi:hypothetical protein
MRNQFLAYSLSITLAFILISAGKPADRNNEILSIINMNENNWQSFVYDSQLFEHRIDTFRKVKFWSTVMNISEDYMIVNHASSRHIYQMVPYSEWEVLTEYDKDVYRNLIRKEFDLDEDERIYITRGKSEFYQFKKVMPSVDRGIELFMENGVDPWYAQAILLIESPGHTKKSINGAYGSFQLMSKVAMKYGLRVDAQVDERKDFDRSAYAASQLIHNICLRYSREMLDARGLEYSESDLFFRLIVLHVYHAGAYNVKNALLSIEEDLHGMDLIKKLWETEAKGFKNASQNYSQVALASLLKLDEIINEHCVIYHSTIVPRIMEQEVN